MTMLGIGLFLANSRVPVTGLNAVPSIPAVTLNFDLPAPVVPPVAQDQDFVFDVAAPV